MLKRTLANRVAQVAGDADVLLTPAVAATPPKVAAHRDLEPREAFRKVAPIGAFTAVFNVSDQPAASIPAGLTDAGLPYGVQKTDCGEGKVPVLDGELCECAYPAGMGSPAGVDCSVMIECADRGLSALPDNCGPCSAIDGVWGQGAAVAPRLQRRG